MIDPDEGWRYGFPKVFPDNVGNISAWLIENGYPEERVKYWESSKMAGVPYRLWETTVE